MTRFSEKIGLIMLACIGALHITACARKPASAPADIPTSAPRFEVTQAEGLNTERAHALVVRATEPLKHCLPDTGGKVNVRVSRLDGELRVLIEPSSSLSLTARACATEALTRVYVDEAGSNTGGPGVPPSNFTSLVTVWW